MRFSSDFEPNSDSCDSFFESGRISALSCIVCRAVFVQCTGGNEKQLASPDRQSDEFLKCQKFWSPLVRVSLNFGPKISVILRFYLITSRVRLAVVCGSDRVVGDSSYCEIVQCETPCRGSIMQCEHSSD